MSSGGSEGPPRQREAPHLQVPLEAMTTLSDPARHSAWQEVPRLTDLSTTTVVHRPPLGDRCTWSKAATASRRRRYKRPHGPSALETRAWALVCGVAVKSGRGENRVCIELHPFEAPLHMTRPGDTETRVTSLAAIDSAACTVIGGIRTKWPLGSTRGSQIHRTTECPANAFPARDGHRRRCRFRPARAVS